MSWKRLFYNEEDKKIFFLIIFIITSFALIAEVSGFTIHAKQSQQFLQNELQQQLSNRIEAMAVDVNSRLAEMKRLANNELFKKLLVAKHDQSDFPALFMSRDLTAIKVMNRQNQIIYHEGKFSQSSGTAIPLHTSIPVNLVWNHGWLAQATVSIKNLGKISMEWRLNSINRFYAPEEMFASTHNFTICAKVQDGIVCSPDNISGSLMHLALQNKNSAIYKALENQRGQITLKDENSEKIISAYSPISMLGLGLVVRINADKLYGPLQRELKWITSIFLITNVIGMIVLYWQVSPRIRRLLISENEALRNSHALHEMAYHDPLTGLDNRLQIEKNILEAIDYAERKQKYFALMFLDLDYFKKINDTLGHDAGDTLLKTMARRLQLTLRSTDHIGRLGGDEFVVIIQDIVDTVHVTEIAKKILQVLHEPVELLGASLNISVSIGISLFPKDGYDIASLMKHADVALYAAKAAGRNGFQFYHLNQEVIGMKI